MGCLESAASEGKELATQDWDAAAQVYLAVVAAHEGSTRGWRGSASRRRGLGPGRVGPRSPRVLYRIKRPWQFPRHPDFNSPKAIVPNVVEQIDAELCNSRRAIREKLIQAAKPRREFPSGPLNFHPAVGGSPLPGPLPFLSCINVRGVAGVECTHEPPEKPCHLA